MKTLIVIPARGGSKGIPGKNIKELNGKPLIHYSVEIARTIADDEDICVSTDSDEIIYTVEDVGLEVPFKRPAELSSDSSGTYGVLLHALEFYEKQGVYYENIMLLQPTSPFRKKEHLTEIRDLYSNELDMVVSVGESQHSPYFTLFEENDLGFLENSKKGKYETRQSAPPVYFYNGSIYLINSKSLKREPLYKFSKVKKYVMSDLHSVDIDTPIDWIICEALIKDGLVG